MAIPKQFECMGFTIKTTVGKMDDSLCGKWYPSENMIRVSDDFPTQTQEQTFWHEFVHCALDTLGYEKLNSDERFVDQMGHCLYQLQKTRKER